MKKADFKIHKIITDKTHKGWLFQSALKKLKFWEIIQDIKSSDRKINKQKQQQNQSPLLWILTWQPYRWWRLSLHLQ